MLGKRKRDDVVADRQKSTAEATEVTADHQTLFKQYFEVQFQPLPAVEADTSSLFEDESEDDVEQSEDSDWEGLSESEGTIAGVEIVVHTSSAVSKPADFDPAALRSFMSSKPPREKGGNTGKTYAQVPEKDDSETLNLKHDLDLQRLLKESHLLEQAKGSTNPASHRHKATDMRLLSLGSKSSLFGQEKMPISHRKGIAAKTGAKEALRRKEALENGIVLEKVMTSSAQSKPRRERGVDAPALGKFRGGTLKLSKNDVNSIQGPRHSPGRARKRVR